MSPQMFTLKYVLPFRKIVCIEYKPFVRHYNLIKEFVDLAFENEKIKISDYKKYLHTTKTLHTSFSDEICEKFIKTYIHHNKYIPNDRLTKIIKKIHLLLYT